MHFGQCSGPDPVHRLTHLPNHAPLEYSSGKLEQRCGQIERKNERVRTCFRLRDQGLPLIEDSIRFQLLAIPLQPDLHHDRG